MEVERLRSFFRRHRRIALDTCVFIYHLESNPKYLECTDFIFSRIERSESKASTSTITMTELLVLPYRERDQKQADEIYSLLSTYPNLGGSHPLWKSPNWRRACALSIACKLPTLCKPQPPCIRKLPA